MANGRRRERESEWGRKWVNQHNYSLMQTTPHCLYSNELMRLQTGEKKKKKNNSITAIVFCRPPKKMSCHPILMAKGVFTQAGINIWLQGLMSKSLGEQSELTVLQVWRRNGGGVNRRKIKNKKRKAQRVMALRENTSLGLDSAPQGQPQFKDALSARQWEK